MLQRAYVLISQLIKVLCLIYTTCTDVVCGIFFIKGSLILNQR